MKQFDIRIIIGVGLLALGSLLFLEQLGFMRGAASLFWGLLFLGGAGYFLYLFTRDTQGQWWAIIPGMVLLAMGGEALLPESFDRLDGAFFLGSIGAAFWIVYLTDRSRWWGIIPAGVLTTLAVVSLIEEVSGVETGGLFFLGLGLTFLLVAWLPTPLGKNQWAYIPGGILIVMGLLLSFGASGLMSYFWPVALILAGGALIFFYFFKRE